MKIEDVQTFEALERYLKEFTNFHGDPAPYDFIGAFRLFLAIVENLARYHLDADLEALEDSSPCFTEQQRVILAKLQRLH